MRPPLSCFQRRSCPYSHPTAFKLAPDGSTSVRFFSLPGGWLLAPEPEGSHRMRHMMTGAELKSIREAYGLSASAMGHVLGYTGPKANVAD